MQYGLPDSLIKEIARIFSGNENVSQAILFGSRAKGVFKPGSGIDIALKGDKLNTHDRIGLLDAFDDLNVPYIFDLILYGQIESPELIDHINRVGIMLYNKSDQ